MWFKATKEKFEEFGHTITTERQLSDGEYIVEKSDNLIHEADAFMKAVRLKTSVEWLTSEEMDERIKLEPTEWKVEE
jgi:hypothetical protein